MINKYFVFIFLLLIVFCISGCNTNVFQEELFRTTADPVDETPLIDSLSRERTISISWHEDNGADYFRLMRSPDNPTLSFKCIYEGTDINYIDKNFNDNERYVYRLDKIRGTKLFKGKNYAFGYSAVCAEDECEPNNSQTNATLLEYDLTCNLPCVSYITNNESDIDCDWFYVNIPPYRNVEIIITQKDLQDQSILAETYLYIQEDKKTCEKVFQSGVHVLKNSGYEPKKVYFKIYPETTKVFSSSYTAVIEYTVSINRIFKY